MEKLAQQLCLSYFIDSMKLKQTIKQAVLVIFVSISIPAALSGIASATSACGVGTDGTPINTSILSCSTTKSTDQKDNGIWQLLLVAINILTAGVGIAAVAGIVYGAVLYTSAGGNADQTKKAIEFIRNVIIGVVAYGLMFSFLNFIIPGGLFG